MNPTTLLVAACTTAGAAAFIILAQKQQIETLETQARTYERITELYRRRYFKVLEKMDLPQLYEIIHETAEDMKFDAIVDDF